MNSFDNIETRKINGHKIAYSADGRSWRIHGTTGNYSAFANVTNQGKINALFGIDRLAYLSQQLKGII